MDSRYTTELRLLKYYLVLEAFRVNKSKMWNGRLDYMACAVHESQRVQYVLDKRGRAWVWLTHTYTRTTYSFSARILFTCWFTFTSLLKHTALHHVCRRMHTVGAIIIWSLADFVHVCPLTKNGTVYNFNHRYIVNIERQNITKKIQNNNIVQILYIYYHIFTWNKYLIHRTIGLNTWWRNLCWQAQRSDVCCSFSAGLHRSWEGFWSTPLCRSSPNP